MVNVDSTAAVADAKALARLTVDAFGGVCVAELLARLTQVSVDI